MKGVPFPRARNGADTLALLIASGGLSGRFPLAPGTVGSALACVLWILAGRPGVAPLAAALVLGIPLAVWAAGRAAALAGGKDPSWIVADEVVGQGLSLLILPPPSLPWLAVSFLLFRLFDIVKPVPVRSLERLPGGVGIVADDLMAGVYAGLTALGLAWAGLLPW